MSDFHEQVKGQLTDSAAVLFPPTTRPVKRERRARRMPLLAAIVAGALLFAAAAFAASQIIGVGTSVTASSSQERPTKTTGVGVPVSGLRRSAISAQLLPISVADPGGGLPWGIRLVRTTRGLLCVQVGRLLDGRLGVLGQDGEFHNDGLFHELPAAVLDPTPAASHRTWSSTAPKGLLRRERCLGPQGPVFTRARRLRTGRGYGHVQPPTSASSRSGCSDPMRSASPTPPPTAFRHSAASAITVLTCWFFANRRSTRRP